MDRAFIGKLLQDQGAVLSEGLQRDEIADIERFYKISFPPDLKELLMYVLPVSDGFINWRDKSKENIKRIHNELYWPLEGMLFDIEDNMFWMDEWGEKPSRFEDASEIAVKEYEKAPKLIPIYSHRYISSEPFESGNPIFSVYQTDIIYYGENLQAYFEVEFGLREHEEINFQKIKQIPFWSSLAG